MEDIKLLVQEEGRSARNLVTFNVPVIETQWESNAKVSRKPPTSPRSLLEGKKGDDPLKSCKRSRVTSQPGSRVRSASTGRDKKSELHARYWAFLFGNLHRAVDEIYQTCETDESVTECKEVIMVLDNYTREFKNLINWFKIKWDYETTPPPQRPHSLAWEIRKSSPGKMRQKSVEPISKDVALKNHLLLMKTSDLNFECHSVLEEKKQEEVNVNEKTHEASKDISYVVESKITCETPTDIYELKEKSLGDLQSIDPSANEANETSKNESSRSDKVASSCIKGNEEEKSADGEIRRHVQPNDEVTTMTDEMCQTDPEKDVDENGPRYRSSSQQTCPILTGFRVDDFQSKNNAEDSGENIKGKGTSSASSSAAKEDVKITTVRTVSAVPASKVTVPGVIPNAIAGRTTIRNSYSHAATTQAKSTTLPSNAKPGLMVRMPNSSIVSRGSTATNQRQPWGYRSVQGKPLSAVTTNSPVIARLTRSKTVAEVRKPERDFLSSKGVKTMPCLRKVVKVSKPMVRTDGKTDLIENNNPKGKFTGSSSPLETSGSAEILAPQTNGSEEDDGWVKVRSKSRFPLSTRTGELETTLSQSASNLKSKGDVRMIHKTRFHQPSSAVSLPTLTFSASDCKENILSKKLTKSKSDAKKEKLKEKKGPEKNGKVEEFHSVATAASNNNSNYKKSKLNGDKPRKNSNRLLNEKNLNHTVRKDSLHARIEKEENEKNSNLGSGKDSGETVKTISIDQEFIMDDDENNFDEEMKRTKEKEEMLQKEINELEAADLEEQFETGDEETDGENAAGYEEEPDAEKKSSPAEKADVEKKSSPKKMQRFQEILSGKSWADHMDTLDELEKLVVQDCSKKGMTRDEQLDTLERLEEFVARHPGRALELHQKLSSPSRRRTMLDTVKKFQARQAKASEKREQLKMEKAQKLRELLKKVDEVKAAKDKLIEDRRQRLEMKLKRAAENRNLHLKEIMRKAHDEEEKLKEIAFINELEAQNKRHDFMTQCQEQEGRLQGIHEERQRKQEEKAAKEAAVEERRKAIEAERQEKLEKMQERQRKRDEQADKKKQEKEKERQELAREKARDRSERLEALHAAQLEAQEELQKKIQQKQEDYARRHEENIEQIRQKALELSISRCSDDVAPRLVPYEIQKLCTACNVLIGSEVYLLSHLRGKKHQETVKAQMNGKDLTKEEIERHNIKIIVNAPSDKIDPKIELDKERIKNFKKKCKKIRMRMMTRGEEYLSKMGSDSSKIDSPGKGKLQKCVRDIEKVIANQGKGQWSDSAITTLERSMGEINRTLAKRNGQDQSVFKALNGFNALNAILHLDMEVPQNMTPYLPQKCFVTAATTYLSAISDSPSNCKFVIFSNKILPLMDVLLKRLTALIPDHVTAAVIHGSKSSLTTDPVAGILMRVIAKVLMGWKKEESSTGNGQPQPEDFLLRLQDIISYTVSAGIVDKLTRYCKSVRDPIDDDLSAAQFLLSAVELLTTLTTGCKTVRQGGEDPTQLLATLQVTELVGAVSILYGMLLHQGAPPRLMDAVPPSLPGHTIEVALGTIRLLRSVAELDLRMFQSILGAEGISLQFRHIASYLLWYCCHDREKILLHEVVAVVGYFAVQHRDNQMILQSGSTPTVLQQLCNLPFPYFSNPELSAILFPTLLACCSGNEENKGILEQEISYSLLEDFINTEKAVNHPLVLLVRSR